MKQALIIGDTGGIGAAAREILVSQGAQVTGVSRAADGLDFRKPDQMEAMLGKLSGPFDLVFIATGALHGAGQPPEKSLKAVTAAAMQDQFLVNTIGPALVLRHVMGLLPKDKPSAVGVLSARVGSISDNQIGGWTSYRAAKAALNQVVRTTAVEWYRTHPQTTLLALHPLTVETPFTQAFHGKYPMISAHDAALGLLDRLDSADPSISGTFWDAKGQPVPW